MKRRTTITLTILGILALTGIFYAANPTPFTTVAGPTGVAASTTQLLVSEYTTQNIDTIDCAGNLSILATLPGIGNFGERYMTIAPSQAVNAGFTQRDVFVTRGTEVFKISGSTVTPFVTIPTCGDDHTGITFDHVGTFGFNLIVTCNNGNYYQVNGAGTPTPIVENTGTHPEGPAVVPMNFGVYGGFLWVADEFASAVHAIDYHAGHAVIPGVVGWLAAEAITVIPTNQCTFCDIANGPSNFQAIQNFQTGNVYQYPLSDFTLPPPGLGGNVLVTSEQGGGTAVISPVGGDYVTSFFDNINGGVFEGSSFVDCDVPTPTPTPTATATSTATATFTPTATSTATATFTPTATSTATSTATATATFTPTPTATATATATPTPTPTPSATPVQVSKITPTGTTCSQFKNGTAQTLSSVNYSVSNGVIHNVNPGVLFYWVRVTVPAGSNTLTITQTITTGNFNTFLALASGSNVFDSNCNSVGPTITQNANITTVTFTAPTAGTYFIGIKYDPHSVVGMPAPSPGTTVHYNFMTTGVPGSTSGLDLILN